MRFCRPCISICRRVAWHSSSSVTQQTHESQSGCDAAPVHVNITCMNEQRTLLGETAAHVFAGLKGDFVADSRSVEDSGLPWVMVSEAAGGFGGGFEDAGLVLTACGRHAVALPIAETIVAAKMLSDAKLDAFQPVACTKMRRRIAHRRWRNCFLPACWKICLWPRRRTHRGFDREWWRRLHRMFCARRCEENRATLQSGGRTARRSSFRKCERLLRANKMEHRNTFSCHGVGARLPDERGDGCSARARRNPCARPPAIRQAACQFSGDPAADGAFHRRSRGGARGLRRGGARSGSRQRRRSKWRAPNCAPIRHLPPPPASPIRFTVRSASRANTICNASPAGSGRGAANWQ